MLTEDFFCTTCRHWAAEYPAGVACPWCGDRTVDQAALRALDVDPVAALVAAKDRRAELVRELMQLEALRREAARRALLGGFAKEAMGAGMNRRQLEGWARGPEEITCGKGHKRSEYGEWTTEGRWRCRACRREKKPVPAEARAEKRRRAERVRDRWAAHEARVAAAEPVERLRQELPPPVRPPGRSR